MTASLEENIRRPQITRIAKTGELLAHGYLNVTAFDRVTGNSINPTQGQANLLRIAQLPIVNGFFFQKGTFANGSCYRIGIVKNLFIKLLNFNVKPVNIADVTQTGNRLGESHPKMTPSASITGNVIIFSQQEFHFFII